MLAEWEPWFTFHAHVPPSELAGWSVLQIADHAMFWQKLEAGRRG